MSKFVDANGREITVGCHVRPLHEATGEGDGYHHFAGFSEVVALLGECIRVKKTGTWHIPVHQPALVVVVDESGADIGAKEVP